MAQATFYEQIEAVDGLFSLWNDCEKVVALYYLVRKLPRVQKKFLAQVLDQFAAQSNNNGGTSTVNIDSDDSGDEEQANNPGQCRENYCCALLGQWRT